MVHAVASVRIFVKSTRIIWARFFFKQNLKVKFNVKAPRIKKRHEISNFWKDKPRHSQNRGNLAVDIHSQRLESGLAKLKKFTQISFNKRIFKIKENKRLILKFSCCTFYPDICVCRTVTFSFSCLSLSCPTDIATRPGCPHR